MSGWPDREEAHRLVVLAEARNPGPWGNHCRTAAVCAERIAAACGLDPERAYVLGLLHDIGRRFGTRHLGHVWDGWQYMTELGYPDAARICLTHSFHCPTLDVYIGSRDIPEEQQEKLQAMLEALSYDDYDRLIQLCDSLAGAGEVMDIQVRMANVRQRYGSYPQEKWNANLALKAYFEEKAGCKSIYTLLD